MTDAGTAQPKFLRIADQLRAAITERFSAGERLPGEDALAKEYGVGAVTIQRALELLKNEGLIAGRRGSGIYVQDLQLLRRHGMPHRADGQWGTGARIWPAKEAQAMSIDEVAVADELPPARVAEVLGLGPDETVCVFDSRYLVGTRPVKLVRTYLSAALTGVASASHLEAAPGDLRSILAELGFPPAHIREEVRGGAPSSSAVMRLGIPVGRAVLETYRVAFADDGQVLGVEHTTMDAAAYVVEYAYDL